MDLHTKNEVGMLYQGEVDASVLNKFPGKLWNIVNSSSAAVRWGSKGKSIVINQAAFEKEFLTKESPVFKTNNMGSFIRQLNLYGFKKITAFKQIEEDPNSEGPIFLDGSEVLEFHHEYFQRGHAELLTQLRRNVGIRRSREIAMQRRIQREMCQPGFVRVRLPANVVPNPQAPGQIQMVVTPATNMQYQMVPGQPRDVYPAYCVPQPPPMPPATGPPPRFTTVPMQMHGGGDVGYQYQPFMPPSADGGQVVPPDEKMHAPFAAMQRNYVLTQHPTGMTSAGDAALDVAQAPMPEMQMPGNGGAGDTQDPSRHIVVRPTMDTMSENAEFTGRSTPMKPITIEAPLT